MQTRILETELVKADSDLDALLPNHTCKHTRKIFEKQKYTFNVVSFSKVKRPFQHKISKHINFAAIAE